MNIREISSRMSAQAEAVASYLLPNGRREGNYWRAGSVCGDSGRSLKVVLSGDRAGRWMDHANDTEHGDLIDLWAAVKSMTLVDALKDVKSWLGIKDVSVYAPTRRPFVEAETKKGTKQARAESPVADYLVTERHLPERVLKQWKIAELGDAIVFPYLKNGKRMMIKYLSLDRSNGKKIWTSKNSTKTLFGWHTVSDNSRSVVITEGEIDAMTVSVALDIATLSIPYGAGSQSQSEWIENDYDDLDRFDEIYIWMDADEAGQRAAREIADRIGIERCRIVKTPEPYNDANEMWVATRDQRLFQKALDESEYISPAALRSGSEYFDEVYDVFYPKDEVEPGFGMGWKSFEYVRFRPAELIVISGFNGHGKSQLAGQVLLEGMRDGERVCVASLEMPVRRVLARLMRQAGAVEVPTVEYMRKINEWFSGRLWVYDRIGRTSIDELLEAFTYAKKRYGVSVFLIDSLMMLGIASDDYNGQKDFVQRIMEWKMEHDATVFLVAHSRKQASEDQRPSKLDVRGAGEITDMADTVLTAWRDKREDRNCDGLIECSKQRNGEREGRQFIWFHDGSCQFRPSDHSSPFRYVDYTAPARSIEPVEASTAGGAF